MNHFDWNRSKEDLLAEMRFALADIFEGTDYTIIRNPTPGEKMNNIYLRGRNRRSAFVIPVRSRESFTLALDTEYLPAVQTSGAKLGEPEEIKKNNRYPNWRRFKDVSYDSLRLALSAFVKHA